MRIFVHSDFENNLNLLTKEESEELVKSIEELLNNPLENTNELREEHISMNVVLLYKYDEEKELLDVTLELVDIINQDKLQRKIDKFKVSKNNTNECKSLKDDINLKEDVKMELEEPIEEVEVLPDAIPSEPIEVSTEPEVSEEERKNALVSTLNNAIMDIYSEMDNLNSILLSFDNLTEEDKATINNILDDRALHIGMLQSIVSKVDPRTSELIYQGMTDEVELGDEVEDEVEDDGLIELEEPEE